MHLSSLYDHIIEINEVAEQAEGVEGHSRIRTEKKIADAQGKGGKGIGPKKLSLRFKLIGDHR